MIARNYPFKIKQIPARHKLGKIESDKPHYRHEHELRTVRQMAKFGHDILLLQPSNIPNIHTADCFWRGRYWEIKAPTKNRSKNIIDSLREASSQSVNVIIDLTRCGRNIEQAIGDILGFIRRQKRTKIERVFLLSEDKYCEIVKNVIV